MVLFGGNNEETCFKEVHVLRVVDSGDSSGEGTSVDGESLLGQLEWFQPEVMGVAPSPRTGHSASLLEDGKTILITGGWDPQVCM